MIVVFEKPSGEAAGCLRGKALLFLTLANRSISLGLKFPYSSNSGTQEPCDESLHPENYTSTHPHMFCSEVQGVARPLATHL